MTELYNTQQDGTQRDGTQRDSTQRDSAAQYTVEPARQTLVPPAIVSPLLDSFARDREWTVALVESSVRSRDVSPDEHLLAIFDVLDDLFHRGDREARHFLEVLAWTGTSRKLESTDTVHFEFRSLVGMLCSEAGLADDSNTSLSLRILMNGCVHRAIDGDLDAAGRARGMAGELITRHRSDGALPGTTDNDMVQQEPIQRESPFDFGFGFGFELDSMLELS